MATEGDGRKWDREGFCLVKDGRLIIRPFSLDHGIHIFDKALAPENSVKKRGVESIGVSWKLPEA